MGSPWFAEILKALRALGDVAASLRDLNDWAELPVLLVAGGTLIFVLLGAAILVRLSRLEKKHEEIHLWVAAVLGGADARRTLHERQR